MAADIDISKFLHPLDLVSPVEAALRLRDSRKNEETQRMFAQAQMARQSAADFRDERDHREKVEGIERQRKIDQANALGTIQQMMRQPGGVGPASALGEAYGINVNPLTATTQAANAPAPGDAVDQFLARNAAQPGTGGSPGPEALMGPGGAPAAPAAPGGVTSGGAAPQFAGSQEAALPEPLPGRPIEGPVELGGDPLGNAPPQQVEGPMPAPPVPRATPADLESLMSRAVPQPTAPPPAAAPMNPLFEAVMGGKHYPISTEQPKTGLSPKFDAVFQADLAMGAPPQAAFGKAYAAQQAEEKEAAHDKSMLDLLGARGDQRDTHDATYGTTAEQRQKNFEEAQANENARAAAANRSRERTAGSGGGDVSSEIANHLVAHPGDVEGAARIAEGHGIHGQKAAALVGGIAADLGKKPPTAGGIDKTKIVRDLDGTPRGLAPSGKGGAAAIQSDLRTNQEALDKLIKIRRSGQTLAIGPEYHDATLALGAVTAGGKTDTNTKHEEGAITNWTGKMLSSEGIDNKIDQLRTRLQEIRSQLAPLPDGYTEERGAPAGRKLSASDLAGGSFLP